MSKTLAATCQAGVVRIGTVVLPDAVKFSEGVGSSEGVAILDQDKQFYLAKTSPDLKAAIVELIDLTTKLTTLVGLVNTAIPSSAAYPDFATKELEITGPSSILSRLTLLKDNLR